MDVVAGLSCGYGVKPERPLIWGFILIIVFALVYKLGNGIRRLKLKENGDSRVSFWDAFYFSVVTFTTVGYGDWYPEDRYRKFVMIEGVLGWLLLALFLVTLANVMIRP
ncbi:Ion channel [Candidatus Methanophagaceae archaeon]|nr:Ion channel [Methanophagales archaeon]